jgi:hypothetical protein
MIRSDVVCIYFFSPFVMYTYYLKYIHLQLHRSKFFFDFDIPNRRRRLMCLKGMGLRISIEDGERSSVFMFLSK